MSEKAKNDRKSTMILSRLSFFLLWVVILTGAAAVSSTVMGWIASFIEQIFGINFFNPQTDSLRYILLIGVLHTSFTASAEKILLRLSFGKWIKGWISASLLSTVLGTMPAILLHQFNLQDFYWTEPHRTILILLTVTLAALPQTWILRRHVKNAWIYFLAAAFGSFITTGIAEQGAYLGLNFASLAIGANSAIVALSLLWLFREEPSIEKAKVDAASSRLEDDQADELSREDLEEAAELEETR